MAPSPKFDQVALVPIDFSSPAEYDELRRQRITCGWNNTDDVLERWRKAMAAMEMGFFWITIPDSQASTSTPPSPASTKDDVQQPPQSRPQLVRAGHIAIESDTYAPDAKVTNLDKTSMIISTLFVDPPYRSGGVARAAMDRLEEEAMKEPYGSPNCKSLCLAALSKKYSEEEKWRQWWRDELLIAEGKEGGQIPNMPPEKGRSNEDMYARRGYVTWKIAPMYPVVLRDGTVDYLDGAYMRKTLV